MKAKGASFFWPSFTDLMTSLFFIMLVLYVLTYLKLSNQQRATEQQLNKIKEIQAAANALPPEYFVPDSINKRFSLRKSPEFFTKTDIFKNENDKVYLIKVGNSIRRLIDTLKIKYSDEDIKYIVLIEGMSSLDVYEDNYPLSYKRALAVKKLWDDNGIILNQSVCEIQIAGSGTGGIGRYKGADEIKNQRILIQIVPKIGEIKIE